MTLLLSPAQEALLNLAAAPGGALLHHGFWSTARALERRGFGTIVYGAARAKWMHQEGWFVRNDAGTEILIRAREVSVRGIAADPLYSHRAIALAARLAGGTPAQLVSDWRRPKILVRARWAVMLGMAKRGAGQSLIGRRMKRDHATVKYGLDQGAALIARDAEFARLVAEVDAA